MKDLLLGLILVAKVVMAEEAVEVARAMVVAVVAAEAVKGVLDIALVTFH